MICRSSLGSLPSSHSWIDRRVSICKIWGLIAWTCGRGFFLVDHAYMRWSCVSRLSKLRNTLRSKREKMQRSHRYLCAGFPLPESAPLWPLSNIKKNCVVGYRNWYKPADDLVLRFWQCIPTSATRYRSTFRSQTCFCWRFCLHFPSK